MSSVAANVAANKERHPENYCPTNRCLWRTGGGYCPRHDPMRGFSETDAEREKRILDRAEMIREDRLCRAEAIGKTIRPNYTGD